jgi:cytochrome o ubiquinol oxidase subunit 1
VSSPPPVWNFGLLPNVTGLDAFWSAKHGSRADVTEPRLAALHVPKNTPLGFFVAFFTVILGFSLIWHIWWAAIVGLLGAIAVSLRYAWRIELEDSISIDTIAEHERAHRSQAARA